MNILPDASMSVIPPGRSFPRRLPTESSISAGLPSGLIPHADSTPFQRFLLMRKEMHSLACSSQLPITCPLVEPIHDMIRCALASLCGSSIPVSRQEEAVSSEPGDSFGYSVCLPQGPLFSLPTDLSASICPRWGYHDRHPQIAESWFLLLSSFRIWLSPPCEGPAAMPEGFGLSGGRSTFCDRGSARSAFERMTHVFIFGAKRLSKGRRREVRALASRTSRIKSILSASA